MFGIFNNLNSKNSGLLRAVKHDMALLSGVKKVHGIRLWKENKQIALAAHIVIEDLKYMGEIRTSLNAMLANRYDIVQTTFEFETPGDQTGAG